MRWLFKYNDSTRAPWKVVLDRWFDRESEGRGVVFTTVRSKDLWASAGRGDSKLPQFWKDALTALRERPLVARNPGTFTVDHQRLPRSSSGGMTY